MKAPMTQEVVILIADDDAGHSRLIEKNLPRAGLHHPVLRFEDGQEILDFQAQRVELKVENNGSAMQPATRENTGMGLNVMRYRAGMIGASLSIESGKRNGVRVTCTLQRRA